MLSTASKNEIEAGKLAHELGGYIVALSPTEPCSMLSTEYLFIVDDVEVLSRTDIDMMLLALNLRVINGLDMDMLSSPSGAELNEAEVMHMASNIVLEEGHATTDSPADEFIRVMLEKDGNGESPLDYATRKNGQIG